MSNLSKPMRDVIVAATDEGLLTVGAARTVTALKTRGLVDDSGLNLTDAGKAVRAELIAPDQGDVNPREDQYAEWERELFETGPTSDAFIATTFDTTEADNHIADYLADEVDRNYVPGDVPSDPYAGLMDDARVDPETGVPLSDRPVETTNDTSEGEDTREAVPGLTKLVNTPHVVPNRKDRRKGKRIVRAFNRLFARKRDEQTAKFAKAERSRKVKRG